MTWRTSRSAKNGLVDLLEGWEWSGGLPRGSELVRRPTRWVESGREAVGGSGGPPGGSRVDGRPSWFAGSGPEALLEG